MWRLIKFVFYVAVIAVIVLAVTGKKIGGKTVVEHARGFMASKNVKESVKDIRILVGEAIKAVGSEIADEMTDEERKQLNDLVRQELQKGKPIRGTVNQRTLPPEKKPAR